MDDGNPASIFGLRRQQTVEEVTKELENVKDDLQVRLSANKYICIHAQYILLT